MALGKINFGRAGHPHRLRTIHQPHAKVERVDADIHARPAAGKFVINESRCDWQQRAAHRTDSRVVNLAEPTGICPAFDRTRRVGVTLVLRRHQFKFLPVGQLAHLPDFLSSYRERFFTNYVLTGVERRNHGRRMNPIWRADIDRIQIEFHQIPVILARMRDAVCFRNRLRARLVNVRDGDDFDVRDALPAGQMRPSCDAARTDDADFKFSRHTEFSLSDRSSLNL